MQWHASDPMVSLLQGTLVPESSDNRVSLEMVPKAVKLGGGLVTVHMS